MTIQEFFSDLPSRIDPSRIAGITSSYVFDVRGVGQWTVRIDDGRIAVSDGAGQADCTISAKEDVLTKIVSGKANPATAYMTGKLKIKGDMDAALKLQKLFAPGKRG